MQRPTLSATSVFSPPSLPLEPAFENIGPETPMRPSIPDPKRARYYAFNRMAAQGSRSDAKQLCGFSKADGPPLIQWG
jgi:hypothetical protein